MMPTPLHSTHANPVGVRGQAPNPVPSLAEKYDQRNGRGNFCRFLACFGYRTPKNQSRNEREMRPYRSSVADRARYGADLVVLCRLVVNAREEDA